MKCPKCGYEDRFKGAGPGEPDGQICRIDQDPSLGRFPAGQITIEGLFAYYRTKGSQWVRRCPKEEIVYRSKTLRGPPYEKYRSNKIKLEEIRIIKVNTPYMIEVRGR